jgi:hypothetical protein
LKPFRLSRRAILRGSAGIAVSLPMMEAMAKAATKAPKRIVFWYTTCGTVMQEWRPKATGQNFEIKAILKPLDTPTLRPHLSLVSGIKMAAAEKSGGNGHAAGMTAMLTGRSYKERVATQFGDVGWGGGISIDQELKGRLKGAPLSSLELGIATQGQYKNFYSYMSYGGDGGSANAVPADDDPTSVFGRLFSSLPGGATRAEIEKLIAKRKSVLDFVLEDYGSLAGQLGSRDKMLLDRHATMIRELELGISSINSACEKPVAPGVLARTALYRDENLPVIGKAQMDLLASAFACDQTRVATLQWTEAQSGQVYSSFIKTDWTKLGNETYHHGISHSGVASSGKTFGDTPIASDVQAAANEKLTLINNWYSQQLAYFAQKLYDTPDVDGSRVLDNTTIVWVSEISEGPNHSFENMPYVLLGSAGGALKTGEFFDFQNKRAHNDLFITLGQAMGVPNFTTFGDPAHVQGPLSTLLV